MFLHMYTAGGYRGTEQVSGRGAYLVLFSWNDYRALDEVRAQCADCRELTRVRNAGIDRWNDDPINCASDHDAFNWPAVCAVHTGIRSGLPQPTYPNGKPVLWAAVRSCSLRQLGHFMMGRIRMGGRTLSVSGPCGADGLPKDYQDVPVSVRDQLVQVPEEIATAYWTDNGHNDIGGTARERLHAWAVQAFPRR